METTPTAMLPEKLSSPLPPLLTPAPIVRGDCIGVVATSYSPNGWWLQRGVKALERAGFGVIVDPDIANARRFSRAEDERRAARFTEMWTDPRVKALICGTGGYGAVRIIPYLDPEIFRARPKAFVGYSDVTALHLWLMRQAGMRVFHGPTVDDLCPGEGDESTETLLTSLTNPRMSMLGRDRARGVISGHASGRLVGGNLSLVQQSIGTRYEVDARGAILFLEETRDPMSVVDERLVHLRASGLLGQVNGIVFGQLSLDRSEEDEFEDFIIDLVSDLHVPVLMDFPAGHENPNLTIPLGTEVELVVEETTGWISSREDALAIPETAASPSAA